MENIVAIRVQASDKRTHFLLTWGRIFDNVNSDDLFSVIAPHLKQFGIASKRASICKSLQEASTSLYFYESFFMMSQEKIPFGSGYNKWIERKRNLILKGKEIYYAGISKRQT
jgi:hypothetical protein